MSEKIDWVAGKPMQVIQEYLLWREAIEKADETELLESVVRVLRSNTPLGPDARELLAKLLDRHSLKKKRGNQKESGLRITQREGKLRMAEKLVAYHRRKGLSLEDAVRATLRENKRDDLELAGDEEQYTDEEIDNLIPDYDKTFSVLENRVRKHRHT